MPLETAAYIDGLNPANPTSTDPAAQGDDHIRLLKTALKATFPNITGPVTKTQDQMNFPVPIGVITLWYGSTASIPAGWALCDGSTVERTDGTGSITTPNLTGRFVRGAGTGSGNSVGTSGGASSSETSEAGSHSHGGATGSGGSHSHSLSISTAPAHSHTGQTSIGGSHNHGINIGSGGNHAHGAETGSGGNHNHGGNTSDHVLTVNQIPAHYHLTMREESGATNVDPTSALSIASEYTGGSDSNYKAVRASSAAANVGRSSETGNGGPHSHGISNSGSHTHTIAASGSHTHGATSDHAGDHQHTISSDGSHTHTGSADAGGSHTHTIAAAGTHTHVVSTVPPFFVLAYIMKV